MPFLGLQAVCLNIVHILVDLPDLVLYCIFAVSVLTFAIYEFIR